MPQSSTFLLISILISILTVPYLISFIYAFSNSATIKKLELENDSLREKINININEIADLWDEVNGSIIENILIGGDFENGDEFNVYWVTSGSTIATYILDPQPSGIPPVNFTHSEVASPDIPPFPIADPDMVLLVPVNGTGDIVTTIQLIPWESRYNGRDFVLFGYLGGTNDLDETELSVSIVAENSAITPLVSVSVNAADRGYTTALNFASVSSTFPVFVPLTSSLKVKVLMTGDSGTHINECGADSIGLYVYF
jgi:hypothetical protein